MSHRSELILIALVLVAVTRPRIGDQAFTLVESLGVALARRKLLVLFAIPLVAISARLALLPWFPAPVPEIHDEFSYLLGADTFTHGRLANPPHPMWVFFETFHVLQHPAYASKYFPAQAAALALGQLLGHPWIGVLLSMALMTASIAWMLQGWFPAPWALLGTILVLAQLDFFTYWIDSYWGGAMAATGGALVLGAFRRIIHRRRWRDSLLLGVGAALLANSRPFEGFIFCLPVAVALAVWLVRRGASTLIDSMPVLIPPASVLLCTVLFMGYFDFRITGNAFVTPEALVMRQFEQVKLFAWQAPDLSLTYNNPQFRGFYAGLETRRFHRSWGEWVHRAWQSCIQWWKFFLGGALSFPLVLTLPWLVRDRRMHLLFVQFFCVVAGMLSIVYFFPHYSAPLTAVVFALVVQAMRHLRQWQAWGRPVGVGLTRVVMLAVLANVPYYAWTQARHPAAAESWSAGRARIVHQLNATPGRHLVIVRYRPDHWLGHEWVYNAADIDAARIVWAREIPGRDPQPLFDYFRDRQVWLVNADASPAQLEPYTPSSK